jgi:TIR domain
MKEIRVFISHSHNDEAIAHQIAARLRRKNLSPWIDADQVLVGDDILERIGSGLTTSDLLVFIISKESLDSEWCKRELAFVAHREIKERKILVVPVIIDDAQIADLPWFLQTRNISRVDPSAEGAEVLSQVVCQILRERFENPGATAAKSVLITRIPEIDRMIANVELGDWESAQFAAIEVLRHTNATGQNEVFTRLLTYVDLDDQDYFWKAIQTIESCVSLAPQLCSRNTLHRMASHRNFSVRALAASICWDLANFAPAHVPVDILIRLSVFDEDWYVQAPANAALKTLASSMPGILRLFFSRLESKNKEECAHSAAALHDIAMHDADLLKIEELEAHLARVKRLGNREGAIHLQAAVNEVRGVKRANRYKYGL